jgi:hypothetical protein
MKAALVVSNCSYQFNHSIFILWLLRTVPHWSDDKSLEKQFRLLISFSFRKLITPTTN